MISKQQGPGCKVLYIEDDKASSVLFEMLMETLDDIDLYLASTAEEGILIAGSQLPSYIFLDINLPGMDGVSALARLQANEQLRDCQMIAVSANAMPEQVNRAKGAGFHEYITKPYMLHEITDILRPPRL